MTVTNSKSERLQMGRQNGFLGKQPNTLDKDRTTRFTNDLKVGDVCRLNAQST